MESRKIMDVTCCVGNPSQSLPIYFLEATLHRRCITATDAPEPVAVYDRADECECECGRDAEGGATPAGNNGMAEIVAGLR